MKREYPLLIVYGQRISWAFVGRVVRACGGNWMDAGRIFLRAEQAKAKNVIAWIQGGLVRNGYVYKPCLLETINPTAAREWVETNVLKYRGGAVSARNAVADLFQTLADRARGLERQNG